MEMTGINEATQVINLIINGAETALKLTGSFVSFTERELKELFTFLYAKHKDNVNDPTKLKEGEVPLKDLFLRCNKAGEKTTVMQIDERIMDEFIVYAKENGLTYASLFDANEKDGKKEIVYREGQSTAFEAFITSKSPLACAYSYSEYLNNATPEAFYEAEKRLVQAEKNVIEKKTRENAEQKVNAINVEQTQISGASEDKVEVRVMDSDNRTWYMSMPRESVRYDAADKTKMMIDIDDTGSFEVYQKSAFGIDENTKKYTIKPDANRGAVYMMSGVDCKTMIAAYAYASKKDDKQIGKTFINSKNGTSKTINSVKDKTKDIAKKTKDVASSVKRR